MKVLFAHDNKFCRGEDGLYYSDGQFPYRLWQRYLDIFDEIVVAGRVRPLRAGERLEALDLSSGPGVSFVEIPSISGPLAKLTNSREAAKRIAAALQNCDALVVRVVSEISRLAYQVAIEMNKPLAVEVNGCAFDSLWNFGNWQGKVYAHYAAYMTKKMIRKAPFALYVTKEFLQKRYPCQGIAVGCSDVQLVKSDRRILAQRLDNIERARNPVRIGLIGSLAHDQKGLSSALEALGLIKDKLPPFQFRVLGGGDYRRWQVVAAEQGVANLTDFCGILPSGSAVSEWLDSIDLYIQPSLIEGLPRALIEAMSRGCPGLGSSAGGIPELLDAECIHRPGDSRALASMLAQAVGNKGWQARQAERNFCKAAQYDQEILDPIRQRFWCDFIKYCETV